MKDVFSKKELVDLEYFIQDMAIKTGGESGDFATTNGCATYYLYLDGFEQRTCLFKPSYFGRNPKGNWVAVDFVIGKNGYCVLGGVRNIDPSVAKNSNNYTDFYKGYVGTYWRFDIPHDFFDYMNESEKSAKIHEGRKVDTFIIYYEERNGETDGYEVHGVQQLKDALKWLHSDKIDVVKITVYKRGKDFDNNHDDVTEYYSWKESKNSARKSIKESMNLDYSDFDYKKFENWIIRYLEDYGCEVNTVEIICDDYGYDVEINVENAENLPSRISDKDYGAFIFDAMYTTNCLYLKMPIVRAMKIAEEFSPKVLKVNDDSILIGDKNSDTEIWLDVWTDNDGDEDYTEWDYNLQSFNLNNYEDMVQKYLQQIDDFFYILDGEVSDNF